MFGSAKPDPVFYPKPDEDFVRKVEESDLQIISRDDGDLYDSTSFVITGKDNSLIFLQAIMANMRPMYTNQVGIHIKYVDPNGKSTFYSHKYGDKDWSFDAMTVKIGGFTIVRDPAANSYHITVRASLSLSSLSSQMNERMNE